MLQVSKADKFVPERLSCVLSCQLEKAVDELNLSKKIISCHPSSLPLQDHINCFVALNRSPSRPEFSEALLGIRTLGSWAFVVVPADDWKALVRGQVGDPVSPAFSMLDQRMTLLAASLFAGTAGHNEELLKRFGMIGPALIDLAITHEMGHGICPEKSERKADDYGKELRDGKTPDCSELQRKKKSGDTTTVAIAATAVTQR